MVEGADSALWHWSSVAGWEGVGGRLASAPSLVSWGSPRLDAFVRGTDTAVRHAWFDTAWHWEGLSGQMINAPAAVAIGSNQLEVFARSSGNQLFENGYR